MYLHVISNFTGEVSKEDAEAIATKIDPELAERFAEQLKPRLVVRSGAALPDHGQIESIYEPYAEVELV